MLGQTRAGAPAAILALFDHDFNARLHTIQKYLQGKEEKKSPNCCGLTQKVFFLTSQEVGSDLAPSLVQRLRVGVRARSLPHGCRMAAAGPAIKSTFKVSC